MDKPSGMSEPASAYLRAVPSCAIGFVYAERGTLTKEQRYPCAYCRSNKHVGCVLDPSLNVKPVNEWDMNFSMEIQSSKPIRVWTNVCGLLSITVREASVTQYCHLQGEVNAITKLYKHYMAWHGMAWSVWFPSC